MTEIVKGTTPTVTIRFPTVDVNLIEAAYLVFRDNNNTIIEKPIADAEKADASLMWRLQQRETLRLNVGRTVTVYCDWRLQDGTRGRSKKAEFLVVETGKNEVI